MTTISIMAGFPFPNFFQVFRPCRLLFSLFNSRSSDHKTTQFAHLRFPSTGVLSLPKTMFTSLPLSLAFFPFLLPPTPDGRNESALLSHSLHCALPSNSSTHHHPHHLTLHNVSRSFGCSSIQEIERKRENREDRRH